MPALSDIIDDPLLTLKPDKKVSVREAFGVESDMIVPGFSTRDPHVPDFDPAYKFDPETTLAICAGFAFRLSFLNKCDEAERPLVAEYYQRVFGKDLPESVVAKADCIGGREQAEPRIGVYHPVLVEQGQLAVGFQHPLDHEHHVGAAGIVFVEHQRHRMLERPG